MTDNKLIRNSTAEFLIFTSQDGKDSIETRYENETIWLTQKLIAELFEVDISTVNEHLKNIYKNEELDGISTIGKFPIVQKEGSRNVKRMVAFTISTPLYLLAIVLILSVLHSSGSGQPKFCENSLLKVLSWIKNGLKTVLI